MSVNLFNSGEVLAEGLCSGGKEMLLPPADLHDFVYGFFVRQDRFLDLVRAHRSPLYVIESKVLRSRAGRFQEAFSKYLSDVSFYYAVKSNNHPAVAEILMQSGMGLDVSSGIELEMAVGLGGEDIVFSGPGKTDGELQRAVEEAEKVVVLVDSFGELARLEKIASDMKKSVRIGVRLNTNPEGLWRKFGIRLDQLDEFRRQANQSQYVLFQGLQFHNSWNLAPAAQVKFIEDLGKALSSMPVEGRRQIEFIDIGGGYWPEQGEWLQYAGTRGGKVRMALGFEGENLNRHYRLPAASIELFAEQISAALTEHVLSETPCRIFLEPGRWLCNDSMHIMMTVIDRKAEDLVITDAATNSIGWERFEHDYFPVLNLSRSAMTERACHILGSLCTPHDVWGYNYWGEDIQPGDVLMIPTQGAYTYSLRQNFIKPLPEVVII